jgi:hypothetical protein
MRGDEKKEVEIRSICVESASEDLHWTFLVRATVEVLCDVDRGRGFSRSLWTNVVGGAFSGWNKGRRQSKAEIASPIETERSKGHKILCSAAKRYTANASPKR